jgi:hypothetical protein
MRFLKMKTYLIIFPLFIDFGVTSSILKEDRKKRLQEEVSGDELNETCQFKNLKTRPDFSRNELGIANQSGTSFNTAGVPQGNLAPRPTRSCSLNRAPFPTC